ncbi:MAG: hypothetical protein WCO84_02795 [bacterium]
MNEKEIIKTRYKELLSIAKLPRNNPQFLDFDYYDVTPVDHDYAGQFQLKANHVFQKLGLPFGFIMMIGDPNRASEIYDLFRQDPKYLGGGTGSGFKNRAPSVLDELDPLAKQIGAINVVVKKDGRLCGYNTDGLGFVRGLEELLKTARGNDSVKGLHVLVLGAGGTADAIGFTLASKGATLTIVNRTSEKASSLAERINSFYGTNYIGGGEELIESALVSADVVINASTKSAEGPLKDFIAFAPAKVGELEENLKRSFDVIKNLRPGTIVCDINLRSDESPTLRIAREAGFLTQNGAPMNFYQAVEALWIIHGELFSSKGLLKEDIASLVKEVS